MVRVPGGRVEYQDVPGDPARAPLLFLHEGLGSVGLWRGFPERVAAATGRRAVAYSRLGHGWSDPPPAPRTPRFMHEEAATVVPALRARRSGWTGPVLVGHSDGASIALLHAAAAEVRRAGGARAARVRRGARAARDRGRPATGSPTATCAPGWPATTATRTPPSATGTTSGSTRRSGPGTCAPSWPRSPARCSPSRAPPTPTAPRARRGDPGRGGRPGRAAAARRRPRPPPGAPRRRHRRAHPLPRPLP